MQSDKNYCMSSWLIHRYVVDDSKNFADGVPRRVYAPNIGGVKYVENADELHDAVKHNIESRFVPGKTGAFISGGIDSGIVARFLPAGTKCWTITCDAPGFVDETQRAKKYADANNLDLSVVKVSWEDYLDLLPKLMLGAGMPVVAIEPQLCKAAKRAKESGLDFICTGSGMDSSFGGFDRSLAKDWKFDEFVEFYTYLNPNKVLTIPSNEPFKVLEKYRLPDNNVRSQDIMLDFHGRDCSGTFSHALGFAGITVISAACGLRPKFLDIARIRAGEPKYMVFELFHKLYPGWEAPAKIPMPRAVDYWLRDYSPHRPEFIPNCTANLTGDQKYLVFALEMFLDLIEPLCHQKYLHS